MRTKESWLIAIGCSVPQGVVIAWTAMMVRCCFVILLTRCFVVVLIHGLTTICTYCSVNKYNQSSYQVVNLTEICVDSECLTQNWVNNLGIWATLVRLVIDAS